MNCRLHTLYIQQNRLGQPRIRTIATKCCESPTLRERHRFCFNVECWACGTKHYAGIYRTDGYHCHHCGNANVCDGSQLEMWTSHAFWSLKKSKTFDGVDDIKLWVKRKNVEIKSSVEDCQYCRGRYKSRGIKLHLKHCQAKGDVGAEGEQVDS